MESIHWFVCLCLGNIKNSLSLSISYLEDSVSHRYTGLPVSPCQRKYPVYGYGLKASNNGVVIFLYNPCSDFGYVKMGFINTYKWYRETCARRLEIEIRKEERFLLQDKKRE